MGNVPTLTVVIPTFGRPTLARTLASLRQQPWCDVDCVLLVGDGPQPLARELFAQFGLPGRYLETPARIGFWGHGARNWVMDAVHVRTSHLAALDDDDEWTPGTLAAIMAALAEHPDRPHLFRMTGAPNVGDAWKSPVLAEGNVGTPMLVTPNNPARLGRYAPRYGGDFDFIRETCAHYAAGPIWHKEVICRVRPRPDSDSRREAV